MKAGSWFRWSALAAAVVAGGCAAAPRAELPCPAGPPAETHRLDPAPATSGEAMLAGRQALIEALAAQGAFSAERQVSHVSHVCTLVVDGAQFPVVDLNEMIHGAAVPRGAFAVLVLDRSLKVLKRIEYVSERPLFCRGAELYMYGDITVAGVRGEGNKLVFGKDGRILSIEQVEANDVPAPKGQSGLVR